MPDRLPDRLKLFSFQHNGQFLFVSNDDEGGDLVVEAHPVPDESRNIFLYESDGPFRFRLKHEDTGRHLFVSNDDDEGDKIVEAHFSQEPRNIFVFRPLLDAQGNITPDAVTPFGHGMVCTFFHPETQLTLFLSNTQRGDDFVIEAHSAGEVRNQFVVIPAPF